MSGPARHWILRLRELLSTRARESARPNPARIDLSVGQADGPPPEIVRRVLARDPAEMGAYPDPLGAPSLRRAAAEWLAERYTISVAPDEVLVVHGTRLAIALAPLAYTEPGQTVVSPAPGYPTYAQAARELGRSLRWLSLSASDGYRLSARNAVAAFEGAELAYLAYPCNPTGTAGERGDLEAAVQAAQQTGTVLVHDAAYGELRHDGQRLSVLGVAGAGEVAIELHSLSKCFHLAGWRIGFAIGRRDRLDPLARVLTLFDSGASRVAQAVAEAVIREAPDFAEARLTRDRQRTRQMAAGLRALGCEVAEPGAAFYVWFRLPEGAAEAGLGWEAVVRDAGIACAPGDAFGPTSEDWIRFAVVVEDPVIDEVLHRLGRLWR